MDSIPVSEPTLPHPEDITLEDLVDISAPIQQAPKIKRHVDGTSANTGPKGVKQDFEDAKLKMRARRLEEKLARERLINKTAVGDEKFAVFAPVVFGWRVC